MSYLFSVKWSDVKFVIFYIAPAILMYFIPDILFSVFLYSYLALSIYCVIFHYKYIINYFRTGAFKFAVFLVSQAIICMLVHQEFTFMNIISPIMGLYALIYYKENRVNPNILLYAAVITMVVFWYTYFVLFNDLLSHAGIDDNAFARSSSNTIPITLFNLLFLCIWLLLSDGSRFSPFLLVVALISLCMVVVQQSRMGLLALSMLTFYVFMQSHFIKKGFKYILISVALIEGFSFYNTHLDNVMNKDGAMTLSAMGTDVRATLRHNFYNIVLNDPISFIFGISKEVDLSSSVREHTRTYNTYLDCWKRYGIVCMVVFIILSIKTIFKLPMRNLLILLPLLLYMQVEQLFLGGFMDIGLFAFLFLRNNKIY